MIKEKLALLPDNPGCYLMKNSSGTVIYVGKAKNLKNRVRSYFIGSHNAKTTALVREISDFEYIITKSELESFVLEINLIKKYDRWYNIKLNDGKTYPYIVITNEVHPRLLVSRNVGKKTGKRFGPYPNTYSARETVRLLNKIYPLRKCQNIPGKECLYYHIKQCLAPCINEVKSENYSSYIEEISSFLKGNTKNFLDGLHIQMQKLSENLEFERANDCLSMINHINNTVEKQNIVLSDFVDRDIFGYFADEENICIQVFYMRAGAIVARDSSVFGLISDPEEMLFSFINQFYGLHDLPKEILIPCDNLDYSSLLGNVLCPKKGDKKRLIDMANDNAKMDLEKRNELYRNKEETIINGVNEFKELIGKENIRTVEMFDNSNTFGDFPVSALVVYKDGKPSKNDYRKYKVKTVVGPDDYNTMREIVYRRYYRLLLEDRPMPDLLVMDGGIGQVNVAIEVISSLNLTIPVMGLKKNDSHQTEAIIFNNKEIPLDKHSLAYRLLCSMQEEVHRFAISFHRNQRLKGMLSSRLDSIKGVGEKRKTLLLKHFKSIDAMKNATIADYQALGISDSLAKEILDSLNK